MVAEKVRFRSPRGAAAGPLRAFGARAKLAHIRPGTLRRPEIFGELRGEVYSEGRG